MKRTLTSVAIWAGLLLAVILATDIIGAYFWYERTPGSGVPGPLSPLAYATRFFGEASVFCLVGIISAVRVQSAPRSGLFALSLGVAYVIYVECTSSLWYYMVGHPTRLDQFYFTAPILAPVIFPTAACLMWHVFIAGRGSNAL